jgi:hypothetical protein
MFLIKVGVFLFVTLCSDSEGHVSSIFKKEAAIYSETWLYYSIITRGYNAEDRDLNFQTFLALEIFCTVNTSDKISIVST